MRIPIQYSHAGAVFTSAISGLATVRRSPSELLEFILEFSHRDIALRMNGPRLVPSSMTWSLTLVSVSFWILKVLVRVPDAVIAHLLPGHQP